MAEECNIVGEESPLLEIKKQRWNAARPMSAQIELTFACNLDCTFCYNVVDKEQQELSTMEMIDVFRKIADYGVLYLTLTGGEPLARRDFFTLGHAARDMGFALRIYTNAHSIDERRADKIAAITPLEVETSIHGARPETHDKLTRVPGSLERLKNAVRLLRERGIKVNMKCPVTRWNQDEVVEVKELCDSLDSVAVFDTVITPRDDGDTSPLQLQATEEFLRRYWSDEMAYLRPDPVIAPRDDASIQAVCGTGRSSFTLDPYGNVFPCVQWRRSLGNLREAGTFEEIWSPDNKTLVEVRDKAVEMSDILNRQEHGRFAPYCLGVAEVQTGDPMGGYFQVEVNARFRQEAYEVAQRRARSRCA
ncbi:MAG: radical SAM protein [Acidobacteriota bacterium]|jgi:radical SAM protein with 4Fe4S-binding SPASM domain